MGVCVCVWVCGVCISRGTCGVVEVRVHNMLHVKVCAYVERCRYVQLVD